MAKASDAPQRGHRIPPPAPDKLPLKQNAFEFMRGANSTLLPFFLVAYPNALEFPHYTLDTFIGTALLVVSTAMLSAATYGAFMGRLSTPQRLYMLLGPAASFAYYSLREPWLAWVPVALAVAFLAYRLVTPRTAVTAEKPSPAE